MPEGPEIRRAADRLEKALAGRVIKAVELLYPAVSGREELFLGQRVESVATRGKAMLTRLSGGWSVYSHNQLYGRWTVNLATTAVSSTRSLRLSITAGRHTARLWSATDIELIPTAAEEQHPFIAGLGPDVLATNMTSERLLEHLASRRCRGRKGATLMLDQKFFAGLGNYLRSEILFLSGVHPDTRPCDLEPSQQARWADAILHTTLRAYESGGITVTAQMARDGRASGKPRSRWRHWVFNRVDQPCLKCRTPIRRQLYGGRRLDFCPACQPALR